MKYPIIISIEGNIGTGKSTILENLEQHLHANSQHGEIIFLKEPVDIWESIKDEQGHTVLEKFYGDQRRYAFTFQVMAYISRLTMLKRAIKENPDCKVIIIERSLSADKNIFMQMLHDDGKADKMEYDIYNKWYSEFIDEYRVNAMIYLDTAPTICAERINKRHRNGEGGIPVSYLERCRDYHTKWLVDTAVPDTECFYIKNESDLSTLDSIKSYMIVHESYRYNVLRINADADVDYSDPADTVGKEWIQAICSFISEQ